MQISGANLYANFYVLVLAGVTFSAGGIFVNVKTDKQCNSNIMVASTHMRL